MFCFFQFSASISSLISGYLTPEIVATPLIAAALKVWI